MAKAHVVPKEGHAVAKNEKTSKGVASKASEVLSDPKASKNEKSSAASALTQAKDKKGKGGKKKKKKK